MFCIDWLNETADSISFAYLYNNNDVIASARISNTDFVSIPYVLSELPDTREALLAVVSLLAHLTASRHGSGQTGISRRAAFSPHGYSLEHVSKELQHVATSSSGKRGNATAHVLARNPRRHEI